MDTSKLTCDCLIIGGGPAGLTAAIYLARFHRNVILIDEGYSRAAYIKTSYNYPGFENGIQGEHLLKNLREQASEFGAKLLSGKVTELEKSDDGFVARSQSYEIRATKVLLATGVIDEKPDLPHLSHIIYEGAVRFCPICDGYEASDKRVGVMGPLSHVIPKALFLRTYTAQLYILPTDHCEASEHDLGLLKAAQLGLPAGIVSGLQTSETGVCVTTANGERVDLDILYPAMGTNPRSGLAINLGADHNQEDCMISNSHQETSVEGLYVAGDLTIDLSQIAVATGQAAIAATDIHNKLPRNFR